MQQPRRLPPAGSGCCASAGRMLPGSRAAAAAPLSGAAPRLCGCFLMKNSTRRRILSGGNNQPKSPLGCLFLRSNATENNTPTKLTVGMRVGDRSVRDLGISAKSIRLWAAPLRSASPPRVPASPPGDPQSSADGRRRRPGLLHGWRLLRGRHRRCRRRIDARGHDAVHGGHTVGEHTSFSPI